MLNKIENELSTISDMRAAFTVILGSTVGCYKGGFYQLTSDQINALSHIHTGICEMEERINEAVDAAYEEKRRISMILAEETFTAEKVEG